MCMYAATVNQPQFQVSGIQPELHVWLTATLSAVIQYMYMYVTMILPLQFDKYPGSLSRYQQKPLTFSVTPKTVNFGQNVTISWSIPVDEATHKDWIGLCVCVWGGGEEGGMKPGVYAGTWVCMDVRM